jgi:hypothetical protein
VIGPRLALLDVEPDTAVVVMTSLFGAAVFVSAKLTVFVPVALAETLYEPAVAFAVKVEEVASPLAFVVATHW